MTRVTVVTGHTGAEWDAIAAITLPGLADYCDRHGYGLMDVPLVQYAEGRPASWGKVPALVRYLNYDDVVVWIDADVAVDPAAPPIHEALAPDAWQAFAVHDVGWAHVPNCGVWVVTPAMASTLTEVWASTQHIHHGWWEQQALIHHMGYDIGLVPAEQDSVSPVWQHTTVMDTRWNAHPSDWRADAYFRHAAGEPLHRRVDLLREWTGMVTA